MVPSPLIDCEKVWHYAVINLLQTFYVNVLVLQHRVFLLVLNYYQNNQSCCEVPHALLQKVSLLANLRK